MDRDDGSAAQNRRANGDGGTGIAGDRLVVRRRGQGRVPTVFRIMLKPRFPLQRGVKRQDCAASLDTRRIVSFVFYDIPVASRRSRSR